MDSCLRRVRSVCSRSSLFVALCTYTNCHLPGGQVYSFGELLWKGLTIPLSAPLLEGSLLGKMVIRVAAGGFHCGALSEQGNIYMWGENTAGQCGLTDRDTGTNVTGWSSS